MSSFLLKTFKGGISDFEDKGIPGAFKFGQALDIRKDVDSLSCQQALTEESHGVFVDLPLWFVPASDGFTYAFGDTGTIYKRTSAGVWSVVKAADSEGKIKGACEWNLSSGKDYLFWATDTKLHCKELPGVSNWSDKDALSGYPKTNLTAADYHSMAITVGQLTICNGSVLAMVGYDGSYSNQALVQPNKYITKAVLERKGYAIIGCIRRDGTKESEIVAWDCTSLDWNDKAVLPGGPLNALIDTEFPLIQAGDGGLVFSDLANTLPILTIPGGGTTEPGGVSVDNGMALFGIYDNALSRDGVYSYGRTKKNQSPTLNLDYPLTCDKIGAVAKAGDDILVSFKNGAAYGVMRVNTAAKATGYYFSLDLRPPTKPGYIPTWESLVLVTAPLPASCAVTAYYKLDKAGDWIQAKMQGNVASFDIEDGQEAVFAIGELARVIEFKLVLTPNGNDTPEIYTAEAFFN
jgi:hypothetical protein